MGDLRELNYSWMGDPHKNKNNNNWMGDPKPTRRHEGNMASKGMTHHKKLAKASELTK